MTPAEPIKPLTHAERAERRERIAEAVRNGADPLQMAIDEKVSWSTVSDACRAAGIETCDRTPGLPTIRRAFKIVQLRNRGVTLERIGESVELTAERVRQIETMAIEAGLLSQRGA